MAGTWGRQRMGWRCISKEGHVAGLRKGQDGDGPGHGRGWELGSERKSLWAISVRTRLSGWGGAMCWKHAWHPVQFWRHRDTMAVCVESLRLQSAQPEQLYIVVSGENQFTRPISLNSISFRCQHNMKNFTTKFGYWSWTMFFFIFNQQKLNSHQCC